MLLTASMAPGESAAGALDRFFEEEHYATLSGEDSLFAEYPDAAQMEYIRALVETAVEHQEALDENIERHSRGWRAERLSRPVRAILRCALCEIMYFPDVPDAAAINEAVELAKKYGESEETPAFVNGVLGGFMRAEPAEKAGSPDE